MLFLYRFKYFKRFRAYSTNAKSVKAKYTDTVQLPKTRFPHYLNAKQIVERDKKIFTEAAFSDLYLWQRNNVRGKEFTLLDGPPYANGQVHIGHTVNKVLKDIIIRAQLLQGRRVHFKPGWDCHGLPIELKAVGKNPGNQEPVEIRRKAREFARKTIENQKSVFQSWGVMAEWDKNIYQTYDSQYVTRQLQIFLDLYNQGYLYRDLKPVYWSPSSRTALAEAELVYKDNHVSEAVTLRLRLHRPLFAPSPAPVFLLIWTTTPWTLPVNEAVCYSSDQPYALVSVADLDGLYVVNKNCVEQLQKLWQREVTIFKTLQSKDLAGAKYLHPWRTGELRPVLESSHVTGSGTGLVHAAPAHGHDDFLVGIRHNLNKVSLIDEAGIYTNAAGPELAGLPALEEGTQFVVQKLQRDIIHKERYTHSYPYDWRTDQPVLIRASQQWFIDTASLKQTALECLDTVEGATERLRGLLTARPYWCISRQRAWGVPIPAFYHRTSGRPLVCKAAVDQLCRHVHKGNLDAWWTLPVEKLFPPAACRELCVSIEDIKKGDDIMDIWVDSGVAWSELEGRIADVCIEGGDQHTGWFQSSLLTSVAARGTAPVKRLLTHGFAVDEDGHKMSKSLGNVVDPQYVVKTVGVDALRWWTASHAHHACVPASDRHLQSAKDSVFKLRGTIRFLLGAIRDATPEELSTSPETMLDRYILDASRTFHDSVMSEYNSYSWNHVCTQITNFVTGPVSSLYVHVVKDRLYCDAVDSSRRSSCRAALAGILETLTSTLAPVMPHLAEEIYLYHPVHHEKFWYRSNPWKPPSSWTCPESREVLNSALAIKSQIDRVATAGTAHLSCQLELSETDSNLLKILQPEEESWDSELTEVLQVASVHKIDGNMTKLTLNESHRARCPRCRRFTAVAQDHLCDRCQRVLQ